MSNQMIQALVLCIWIIVCTLTQAQNLGTDVRQFLTSRGLLQSSNGNDVCQFQNDGFYQELSGGVDAPLGRFPYMIAIQVKQGGQFNHHCGGTLIAPDLILTAAHCIYIQGKYDLRATDSLEGKLGDKPAEIYASRAPVCRHQSGDGGRIRITDYYYTSDYVGNLLRGGDIAILKTETPFTYNGPFVNFQSSKEIDFNNSRLFTAIGYGATDVEDLNARAAEVLPLQLAFFAYENNDVCQEKLFQANSRYRLNLESNVCFGYKGKDTCSGDSGGPMLLADNNYGLTPTGDPGKDIQVGITSWGPVTDCTPGDENNPGVYTKVSNYIDWIASILQTVEPEELLASTVLMEKSIPSPSPSPSPSPVFSGFDCSDNKPPGVFTCYQQALFGKCDESWMIGGGYCQASCGRCLLAVDGIAENGQECVDVKPPGRFSCEEQRQFSKCNANWMISQNYCQKTCGRCGANAVTSSSSSVAVARSTLQCFGEPQANFKGRIIKVGTENFKDSVEECCTSCDENPDCNVYVFCPRLEGCRNVDEILDFGRCDLKYQEVVAKGGEPEVWYRGNETDFTSGYIFGKTIAN